MNSADLQRELFSNLKKRLPQHISLVDEIADLLEISNDSAYRRMRGDKPLTLGEIQKLCSHFMISFDRLFHLDTDITLFTDKAITSERVDFDTYLQSIIDQMQKVNSFREKKMYYTAKDVPVFHYFLHPEIAAFKFFFWRKTILNSPELQKQKFHLDDLPKSLHDKGKKILSLYNEVPSVELWNVESINGTIRQIEFYKDSKVFSDSADIVRIYEKLVDMIGHIEEQAIAGHKFFPGESPGEDSPSYQLFFNEVFLGDNTILASGDDTKVVFINHSVLNFLTTRDARFCNYIQHSIENFMRRSTQISTVGERDRSRFFDTLRRKLDKRKQEAMEL